RENLVKIYTKCEEYAINQVCSKGCPAYGENIDEITTENFNIFCGLRRNRIVEDTKTIHRNLSESRR
ncbi:MAG: hypothetical protein PHV61_06960, partial [Limnochordia bacterium]|nr:hypothetical protein [Limnochordia bacterium]